jgi:hypothetical protein
VLLISDDCFSNPHMMRVGTFNCHQPVKRKNGSTAYELVQNPMGANVRRDECNCIEPKPVYSALIGMVWVAYD